MAISLVVGACSGPDQTATVERVDRIPGEDVPGDTATLPPDPVEPDEPPPTGQPDRPGSTEPGSTEPGPTEPISPVDPTAPTIEWEACGTLECGWLEVPFDHDAPDGRTFSLYVVRRPADRPEARIGSLLVNPGGPGFGGSVLAQQANFIYSDELLERFDIVGWDPRGTGVSEPAIDCIDDIDPYFAVNVPPLDEAGHQALVDAHRAFGQTCVERAGDLLPYVSTEASARDIDLLRQALGEERISYFGFSYGSELGATWLTLFPDTVRAAVLDGAVDPNADYIQAGLDQARGFESQLDTFLARCSTNSSCRFHNDGDAEGAFDALAERLNRDPLPVRPDRTPVNGAVMFTGVASALYGDFLWPQLERALADAQEGDGARLLSLYDSYYQARGDGTFGNEIEAFLAISCLDDPGPRSVEEVDSYVDEVLEAAPRLGAGFAYGYTCALWPVEPVGKVSITGAGAGPVLVVGVTGDAATPLESTRAMAAALEDGRLVVVTADQHGGYGANNCVVDAVDTYLIDLDVSIGEITC